ncbi:MAG: undecaprenyl-diphosphatase UppP [Syntrophales bacterium]|nr:undecaprenyl-diphosphatase UppP [Syntrophales bacterium]
MGICDAIVLGIVEGISEFLPISSTGHLILTSFILGLGHTSFLKSFEIAIQVGAIFSVVILYGKNLLRNWEVIKRVFVSLIPTVVVGATLYRTVKEYWLGSDTIVIWSLFIGGIFLIVFEWWYSEKPHLTENIEEISYRKAFIIGVFQSIALIPGVSRAAATIVGGLIVGLKRKTIVEFSFLLAVPTMMAATGYDILKSGGVFSWTEINLLVAGFISSFIVAILSIKFLLRFIQTHTFIPFGIYRIAVAILWVLLFK